MIELAVIPIATFDPISLFRALFGPATGPTPAPTEDLPEGVSESDQIFPFVYTPPSSINDLEADPDATSFQKWKKEFELKMIAGAAGAIAAAVVTTPGFMQGVGEVVKGIGEIVPG